MLNLLARVIAFIIYPFVRGRVLAEARALTAVTEQRRAIEDAQAQRAEQQQRDDEAQLQWRLDRQLVSAHVTKSQFADCTHDAVLRFASGRVVAVARKRNGTWVHPGRNAERFGRPDPDLVNLCEVALFEFQNKIKVLPVTDAPADEDEDEDEDEDTA